MKCPECQSELPDNAKFCPQCGLEVGVKGKRQKSTPYHRRREKTGHSTLLRSYRIHRHDREVRSRGSQGNHY